MNTIECPKCHHLIPAEQALAEQAKNNFDKEMEEKNIKKEIFVNRDELDLEVFKKISDSVQKVKQAEVSN